MLQIPGFTPLDDLSRFELKVTNLTAPSYDVLVDGQKVATYTQAQLAAGVNLSSLTSGPIFEQQQALLKAILLKNNTFFRRWRQVQLAEIPAATTTAPATPNVAPPDPEAARVAELKSLDDKIAAMEAQINTLRLPKPHVWTLQPTD